MKHFLRFFILASMLFIMHPVISTASAQDQMLGEIRMFGFNFCPRGWLAADGSLQAISSNTALFSLYGCTYGGDCRTTFGVPDLRGRAPIHMGHGPGLSHYVWGGKGGTETTTLNILNLPSHNHSAIATSTLNVSSANADTSDATGNSFGSGTFFTTEAPDTTMHTQSVTTSVTIGSTGNQQSFNNMPPFLTVNICIAETGVFPSRN